jgi:hypothetical protein
VSSQRGVWVQKEVRQAVTAVDPLVLNAVADVDQGLLRWSLTLSPRERLRACSRAAATFARLRRAASGVG